MPDEVQQTQQDVGAGEPQRGTAPETQEEEGAEEKLEDGGADERDGPEGESGQSEDQEGASPRTVNPLVVGSLTLHYAARDVTLSLDGEAAMRVLTMFWRRYAGPHADRLEPETSSALSGWLVFDLDEPLAVSWHPILGVPTRTAIDPVLPQAA